MTNSTEIEFCFNRQWSKICGDHWDEREAQVACRELGYDCKKRVNFTMILMINVPDSAPITKRFNDISSGRIVRFHCYGEEAFLRYCELRYYGNCAFAAGVVCLPGKFIKKLSILSFCIFI